MASTIIWALALVVVALVFVVGAVALWIAIGWAEPSGERLERALAERDRSRPEQRAEADHAALALDAPSDGAIADDGPGLGLVVGGGDPEMTPTRGTGNAGALGASGVRAHESQSGPVLAYPHAQRGA